MSLSDIWVGISRYSENGYNNLKKMSKFNWAALLCLPLIYYLTREEEG